MSTVALIGVDGAGKTTIAKKLLGSFPMPLKYLYMGRNIESSNFALPTSRLIQFLKRYISVKLQKNESTSGSLMAPSPVRESRAHDKRGKMAATARLLNRLAEDCYRQVISWSYQLRGYIVLYDRHFFFDAARSNLNGRKEKDRLSNRVHRWFLNVVYPKPDLVIFLDAPPGELFNRKVEVTLDYLEMRRKAFLHEGTTTANFFCIDAAQPVENVYADVHQCILRFFNSSKEKTFETTSKRTAKADQVSES